MATTQGGKADETVEAKIAAAAAAVKTRVEKHWKVEEQKESNEEDLARNLDFGNHVDYYETPTSAKDEDKDDDDAVVVDEEKQEVEEEEDIHDGGRMSSDPLSQDVWEEAFDQQTSAKYYFNRKSGVTQWEKPAKAENVVVIELPATDSSEQQQSEKPSALGDVAGEREPNVWYYRDIGRKTQGPFGLSVLQQWISYMPMDILVWCDLSKEEEKNKGEMEKKLLDSLPQGQGQDQIALPLGEPKAISFACLLGYGSLLGAWRDERGSENCMGYGIAPTISVYKTLVGGQDTTQAQASDGGAAGGHVYPIHQPAGTTSSHSHEEYSSTGFFDSRTRRLKAEEGMSGTVSNSLGNVPSAYWGTGLQHHMDLSTFEQQMQAMKERKKKKLSREAVEKLKARKKELKRKQAMASL